jgi:hypothetical protein
MRDRRLAMRLHQGEMAALDELRGDMPRAVWLRRSILAAARVRADALCRWCGRSQWDHADEPEPE